MTAPSVGRQMGKTEMVGEAIQGVSPEELVVMANDWWSTPIDVRFRFTWPLRCKLAVKALIHNKPFDDLCEYALREQLEELKHG